MRTTQKQAPARRRRYTPQQRAAVLADVAELGIVGAARKHEVPVTTVSQWNSGKRGAVQHSERAEVPTTVALGEATCVDGPPSIVAATTVAKPQSFPAAKTKSNPVAKRYTPSQRAEVVEYAAEHGATEAAKKFGVSRFSVHQWRRSVEKAARGEGPAPTAGPAAAQIEAQRDAEILGEWKKHPGLGPSQIRNQLRRRGVKVSVHTTRRVMESAGYRPVRNSVDEGFGLRMGSEPEQPWTPRTKPSRS